jgi:hypothetical protein
VMVVGSQPTRPWLTFLGVEAVALLSIPFGLAVGAAVPRELEGTLVLIGVIGMELAVAPDSAVAKVLPFYGPQQLISSSLSSQGPLVGPLLLSALYGLGLLFLARLFVARRVDVTRHARTV